MTKRAFNDAFDDLTDDMVSTVIKHAKTVDLIPFVNLFKATAPVVSILLGFDSPSELLGIDSQLYKEKIDHLDEEVICRTLTNIEKMLTANKHDRSSTDNSPPSPQSTSQETAAATSETPDHGQTTAGNGDAPATSQLDRADGDETAGEKNNGCPGRDPVEYFGTYPIQYGPPDKK